MHPIHLHGHIFKVLRSEQACRRSLGRHGPARPQGPGRGRLRRRQSRRLDAPLPHHRAPGDRDDGVLPRRMRWLAGIAVAVAGARRRRRLPLPRRARGRRRQGAVRARLGAGAGIDPQHGRARAAVQRAQLRRLPSGRRRGDGPGRRSASLPRGPRAAPARRRRAYGHQLQTGAVPGLAAEGAPLVRYTDVPVTLAGGRRRQLRRPDLHHRRRRASAPPPERLSPRLAPSLRGLGLLAAVPAAAIAARADPLTATATAFAAAWVPGRFGLRGRAAGPARAGRGRAAARSRASPPRCAPSRPATARRPRRRAWRRRRATRRASRASSSATRSWSHSSPISPPCRRRPRRTAAMTGRCRPVRRARLLRLPCARRSPATSRRGLHRPAAARSRPGAGRPGCRRGARGAPVADGAACGGWAVDRRRCCTTAAPATRRRRSCGMVARPLAARERFRGLDAAGARAAAGVPGRPLGDPACCAPPLILASPCSARSRAGTAADLDAVGDTLRREVLVPLYADYDTAARALAATAPDCAGDWRAAMRPAFVASLLAWRRLEAAGAGPAAVPETAARVYFWPDKHGTAGRQLAAALRDQPAGPRDRRRPRGPERRPAEPGGARAAALRRSRPTSRASPAASPSPSPASRRSSQRRWRRTFAQRSAPTVPRSREAMFTGMRTTLDTVIQLDLERPLGTDLATARGERARAWRSGLSLPLIGAALDTVERVYTAPGRLRREHPGQRRAVGVRRRAARAAAGGARRPCREIGEPLHRRRRRSGGTAAGRAAAGGAARRAPAAGRAAGAGAGPGRRLQRAGWGLTMDIEPDCCRAGRR